MILGVVTDPYVGGTFLTWTLHFLSGHERYYSVNEGQTIALTDYPINGKNAHSFKANQPFTYTQFQQVISQLQSSSSDSFHTVYFHNLPTDTDSAVTTAQTVADKVIVVSLKPESSLYHCSYYRRDGIKSYVDPNIFITDPEQQLNEFIDRYFKESRSKFGDTTWELREFLALNLVPDFLYQTVTEYVDLTKKHYMIEATELFSRFDITVKELFRFLELQIDQSRWHHWLDIYHKWQSVHSNRLQFVLYFDNIITAILNNHYIDLTRFNLDIVQEAAIQRELLYKYNTGLKSWKLEKFNDTQQLHALLEENTIHKL